MSTSFFVVIYVGSQNSNFAKEEYTNATLINCSSDSYIRLCKKSDGTVFMQGFIKLTADLAAGNYINIGAIPESFSPTLANTAFTISNKSGGTFKIPVSLTVSKLGSLALNNPTGGVNTQCYSDFAVAYKRF